MIAYNLHGRASGTDEREIGDFILEELRNGNLGWNPVQKKISLAYGSGSKLWREDRDMSRTRRNEYIQAQARAKTQGPSLSYGEHVRRELNKSGQQVAISYQDTTKNGKPNHFFLIVRDEKGVWKNMDHTARRDGRRGEEVIWSKVHGVDFIGGKE